MNKLKFYIEIKSNTFGTLKSEIFEGNSEQLDLAKKEILDRTQEMPLDIFDQNGNLMIIGQEILKNSIIYIKRVK